MKEEDIEFIKNYIDFRLSLVAMGLLSDTERRICQIFIKILEKEGVISNDKWCERGKFNYSNC